MTSAFNLRALLPALLMTLSVTVAGAQPLRPKSKTAAPANAAAIIVGKVTINKSQIDTLVTLMARSRGAKISEVPPQQVAQMKKMVATNLIGQELLEMEAKAQGIKASPQQVDSALRVLRSQFPDAATYQRAMKASGETDAAVRAKISRQLRADQVLAANVSQPAMPTEAELHAFWEKNKNEFPVSDSLRAVQILIQANDNKLIELRANCVKHDLAEGGSSNSNCSDPTLRARMDKEAKSKLEALRRDLVKDSTDIPVLLRHFMSEAARNGEGPEAQIGGDLQRFDPDDFNPEFKKQVLNLRVGQISPVFHTPLGWHLVMVIEKYDGKFDSYRLLSMQNLMAQRNMQLGTEMREFLRKLAAKYPVKYIQPGYKDASETGIY